MSCPITGETNCKCDRQNYTSNNVSLKETMRKLFTDHAVYTKFFIESALEELPDQQVITVRLLDNQSDIGTAVGSITSKEVGKAVTDLLKKHILAAAGAVTALKSENKKALDDAIKKLFDNSKQVSSAISSLNPETLPHETVLKEFNMHNQYVLEIATLHFNKQYEQEYKKFDAYYNHMLSFSDMLVNGLDADQGQTTASSTNKTHYTTYLIFALLILVVLIMFFKNKEQTQSV